MSVQRSVNIIATPGVGGMSRDVQIVTKLLQDNGFYVTFHAAPDSHQPLPIRLARYLYSLGIAQVWRVPQIRPRLRRKPIYDINLFLEVMVPLWYPHARVNYVIPNQEWTRPQWQPFLRSIDCFLCKTRHAESIFSRLGYPTRFISFSSLDRLDPTCERNYNGFLHLAGLSNLKGQDRLVRVWQRHPEWSRMVLIEHPSHVDSYQTGNINHIREYLDDAQVRQYQNTLGLHLCPSKAEGFGHSIVEGMSCGAVVITTNAPPMNELVQPDRGVLVNYSEQSQLRLGTQYLVDLDHLDQTIQRVMALGINEKKRLGDAARDWYLDNDRLFRSAFIQAMRDA